MNRGTGHHHHDHGGANSGIRQRLVDLFQIQSLVDEDTHKQGVDGADGGGLGDGSNTGNYAAYHENRKNHSDQGIFGGSPDLRFTGPCFTGIIVFDTHIGSNGEKRKTDDDAWNSAGHKKFSHGQVGNSGDDDHGTAGRDDDANHRAGGVDGCGKGRWIAAVIHFRDQDGAYRGGVRHRGARDASQDHAGDHGHTTQTGGQVADQNTGKVDQLFGDTSL